MTMLEEQISRSARFWHFYFSQFQRLWNFVSGSHWAWSLITSHYVSQNDHSSNNLADRST